ncbi:unnamed protein product [Gongylonema pulchrum]|uniref:ZP domain-containing protein n=1 Tax=Gongylonema pulchrum TaxID=637853 RepID=A0A183DDF5_9BILA|nr:unnamed protein product [Gongylonema pulchrum]
MMPEQSSTLRLLLLSLSSFISVLAIPIDNGVEGDPEIECGATAVSINFNTRNPFEGHVFVKGLYDHEECRSDSGGRQVRLTYLLI